MEGFFSKINIIGKKWQDSSYATKCKISEIWYLVAFAVWLVMSYNWSTMIEIPWPENTYFYMQVFVCFAVFFRYMVLKPEKIGRLAATMFIVAACVMAKYFSGAGFLLETSFLIIGAVEIDYRKILKLCLAIEVPITILTIIGSQTGYITNLVYHRDGHARNSFGFVYPTNFAAHIVFIVLMWVVLRQARCTLIELGIIDVIAALLYVFCDAKCSVACLLLVMILVLYIQFQDRRARKNGTWRYKPSKKLVFLCLVLPFILACVMILLSRFYMPDNTVMAKMNDLLTARLYYGKMAFDRYDVQLWGQNVVMNGYGGSTEPVLDYFYIDCSYVNILMRFGPVVLAVTLGIIAWIVWKNRKNPYILAMLMVVCIHSAIEQHLFEIYYNIFLILPFAKFDSGTFTRTAKVEEKKSE